MFKKFILQVGFSAFMLASQAQALLPTFWNFSTPSIASPPTGWTLGLGTNGSLTYAGTANSVGGDNTAARLDATNEYITIWIADKPGPVSYWIKGTGISPAPSFSGTFKIQESINGTAWNDLRSFTTLTGTMTRYVDNPASASRYIRFFYTDKQSGSNIALDSVIIKEAPVATTPTIVVSRNSQAIANNTQNIIGNSPNFSFQIKNIGTIDTLIIDSVNYTGINATEYSFSNPLPIKIAAKDSIIFNGILDTSGVGSRFASFNIFNNDIDKSKFTINLYGIAGKLATEPLYKPLSLTFNSVTAYSMNVTLADTSSQTENYIVLRKIGNLTETPIDGQTYQRGDYIGAAQVAYVGKVGTFKPTYVLANTNYSYTAFAYNGPATFENYLTTSANSTTINSLAGNAGTYYNNINSASPTFLTDLSAKINVHDTIFYGSYITTLINNFLTRDTTFGKKVVNCVYSGVPYIYNEPFVWWASGSSGILTREHSRAQSTMPSNNATQNPNWPNAGTSSKELPEYNDQHNLFPTDQVNANAPRSNNPFGECVTVTSTSPTGFGKLGKDALNNTIYEPKDEQKGNLARALFYMSVCYNGVAGNNWKLPANQDLAVLLKWHQQDPPNAEEIARNEYIASIQHNRNPFIDNPSWANLIDFKTMTLVPVKSVAVNTPNGGENLVAGKTTNITWFASLLTTKIKLEYTTNGTNYILIDSVNASPATYSWTVPAIATTNAKIRISATDNSVMDTSNANFSINIPNLKLLTPITNEVWNGNANKTITWQSAFVDSIAIVLKDNNSIIWSGKELASKGTITLTVPNTNTANARVFINEIAGNLKDSSAFFQITPVKQITVNTPNGGESLIANKTTNITWTAIALTSKVKLEYTTNGTNYILIDSVSVSPATYTWTVPVIATTTAKIRVTATDNSTMDTSNANFTINVPTLKLLTPVATDVWYDNETRNITWQSTFIDSVTIELKDGNNVLLTQNELASKGVISVKVPLQITSNAKVFISEINGTLKDSSAKFKLDHNVGVNEISNTNFNVYPNPSNGNIFFTTDLNLQQATYEIFDATGKLIIKDELSKTNSISIQNKGIFILKALIDGKSIIRKIVVE